MGRASPLDTACSSSLVALAEAVVNLRSGRIDTAIVGGVNMLLTPYAFIGFSQASMLSRRGLCQAFSKDADGYVRAEGGAVLVLRTREAAERDGDHIHGLIVGADVNSDGRTNGISLPSKAFQSKLLHKLYIEQGLDPADLAFVEAHGTGTPVGDPIEATAIGETLASRRAAPLLIGSIKTNIGHMEPASGLGGVLKAMLALEHDILPPSLHSEELTPHIDFEALNLEVARRATPLPPCVGGSRLAGVNSFGFGGTNAHVVLADPPRRAAPRIETPPAYLLPLRAQPCGPRRARCGLRRSLRGKRTRTRRSRWRPPLRIAASGCRIARSCRSPASSAADVAAILDHVCDEEQDLVGAARGTAIEREAPVAFVFSGNGSQFAGMGLAAYRLNPVVPRRARQHLERFRRARRLVDRRYPAGRGSGADPRADADRPASALCDPGGGLPCLPRAGVRARHRARPQRRRGRGGRGGRHPRSCRRAEDDLLAQPAPAADGRARRHGRRHRLAGDDAGRFSTTCRS